MRLANKNTAKNKMKRQYVIQPRFSWSWYCHTSLEDIYYSDALGMFRAVRTTQAKRYSFLIDEDREHNINMRGKRSNRGIPSSWDDICVAANDETKSWKRNSKRKKQWKYE